MKNLLFLMAAVAFVMIGCRDKPVSLVPEPKQLELPGKANDVIGQSNEFGIDLFTEVAADEEGNLMISPLSASVALTMLLNGCHGNTYTQIHQVLGYEGLTIDEVNATYQSLVRQLLNVDPEIKLALANAVFYRNGFQVYPSYLGIMDEIFSSDIEGLDFESPSALDRINGWASDNTFGKIPKVLDEISPQAVMFLMNALYFKGTWTYQFDKDLTADGPFIKDDGSTVKVPMMQGHLPLRVHFGNGYTAIEMTYGRQNFSMVVIQPDDKMEQFLTGFTPGEWKTITQSLDGIVTPTEYDLVMPRFKFDFEKKLNEQLESLGMTDAFIPSLADLSGIADAGIFVSFVKQNTFVEVNEEGTEAAAVTTIGIELTSINSLAVVKPFIFAIRERTTNTLLFIGKVMVP